jgi:TolB-like protein
MTPDLPQSPPPEPPAASGGEPRSEAGSDVFVSYASQDAAVAMALVEALERRGLTCWIAPRNVVPGSLYADGIVRAISSAQLFALLLSEHAIASPHVGKEIERASSKRRPIIALHTDSAPLTPAFEYFLSESQWIELTAGAEDAAAAKLAAAMPGYRSRTLAPDPHAPPDAHAARPAARRSRVRALGAAGVAALALALAYFAFDNYRLSRRAAVERPVATATPPAAAPASTTAAAAISEKSIAVLPFADMSERQDQQYLADGMAEEIINLLAKVADLHVPARTSSFYFKGKSTKVPDIARELQVAHVLEGSVRRSGDHLRVTAQLVRADNGYHLWSETYDRNVHDIFKVQDEIANAVVQALQITLLGGPLARRRGGTENLEAYQLFLRGLSSEWEDTRPALLAARDYFERAIKLDPQFGLAWAELSRATALLGEAGAMPPNQAYESSRQFAQHALRVSPDLAEAHAFLLYVHRVCDWDWTAAELESRRALALDPTDPTALMLAGALARTLGRWTEAERHNRAALVRDPLFTIAYWQLGLTLYGAGRNEDAAAAYRKLMEIAPSFSGVHAALAVTLLAEGNREAADAMVRKETAEEYRLGYGSIVLQAAGHQAEADEALQTLVARRADTDAYYVAMTHAYRGDHDRALEWLERAYRQREASIVNIVAEPLFRNLAGDPRYKAFLRKLNLPE